MLSAKTESPVLREEPPILYLGTEQQSTTSTIVIIRTYSTVSFTIESGLVNVPERNDWFAVSVQQLLSVDPSPYIRLC
jgi:hypothetical protein